LRALVAEAGLPPVTLHAVYRGVHALPGQEAEAGSRLAGGTAAPELDGFREALVRFDRPDLLLDWLKTPGVRRRSTPQPVPSRHETPAQT
jgi:hypothetical protein